MADHGDDLDQLLDSALDDFQSLNLTSSSSQRNGPNEGNKQEKSDMPIEIQGLGMGLPDLRSKKKGKQKVAKDSHASEALGKLREHTREAVKSLESVTEPELGGENLENETIEGWVKQFEELAASKEMETIMETVMKQLLSKEVLQEPIKEICGRYPKWFEDNKSKTSKEEYERFLTQYQLMKELSEVFETTDSGNSNKIFDLMQKMQECGQPPNDIMQQLGGSDFSNLAHLSPEMLEQCSIM